MAEIIVGMGSLNKRINAIASPKAKHQYMTDLGVLAVYEAKTNTRKFRKTGDLGAGIQIAEVTEESVTIEAIAPYSAAVEGGSKPHIIRAHPGKVLRWAATAAGRRLTGTPRKGAAVLFAMFVRHPGTKAQPFLRPGAEKAIERFSLADAVVNNWNEAA